MSGTLSLAISKQQRGPNLKLFFSITGLNCTSEGKESEHIEINDLASVKFKVINREACEKYKIYMSMMMKQESSKNSLIRIKVTSEALNFSKQLYCPQTDWTEWALLGTSDAISVYKRDINNCINIRVYCSLVDLSICMCKEEPETNPKLSLYLDPDLTDFQLTTTANGSVSVHRACLAARSDYFKKMFTGKWKEAVEGKLEVKDVTGQNLQDLKDFLYLGTLPEPDDRLRQLIVLGRRFLIEDLVAVCAKKLAETVSPENLFALHELACLNNIPELTSAITELTSDEVITAAYQLKTNKNEDTAPENVKKE